MGFSGAQQPELRKLLWGAWEMHCRFEGAPAEPHCDPAKKRCGACAYCAWYEQELYLATGHTSTTECNAGEDYDKFMERLEIAIGASIKWQMKRRRGPAIRIIHELQEVTAEHGIDEEYLRGVARRILGLDESAPLPELHLIPREKQIWILGEVKRFVRRRLKRETAEKAVEKEAQLVPVTGEAWNPF